MRRTLASLSVLSLILVAATAAPLDVGCKAPQVSVETWVKGKPVRGLERGKVYVVEFWATWCAPCRASIPHLTELQKRYPEAAIIGIACAERPTNTKGPDDRLSKLEAFVKEQGDTMNYRVGFDADGSMKSAWMAAAQQRGIPCAFLVDADGKIAFIGQPTQLDAPLKAATGKGDRSDVKKKDDGKPDSLERRAESAPSPGS